MSSVLKSRMQKEESLVENSSDEQSENEEDELFQSDTQDGDDESDGRESYDEESDKEENKLGLEAMGDVITKILNKKGKLDPLNFVLSKSKSSQKIQSDLKEDFKTKKEKIECLKDQRELNHVLPGEKNDAPKEARLRRIGTKGVVMLFNAVSKHQKEKADKMKSAKTESDKIKVEKSMKKSTFMDMLKVDGKSSRKTTKQEEEDEGGDSKKPTWDVLKNDFMLGSKLKHWDREEEDGNSKKKKKKIKETLEVESSDAGSDNDSS